jgi:ribonuclease P protein component
LGTLKNFRFPSQGSYAVVASKGKKFAFGLLILKIFPASDSCSRFCFVVKKKNGCAAFRNRCRRILRNVFFNEAKNFKNPLWVMATLKMNENEANWKELRNVAECAAFSLK